MKFVSFCFVSALALSACLSQAADSGNMAVTANVAGTCKFLATPDAAFGALDPAVGNNATASAAVKFWCSKNATYSLAADNGANYDTSTSRRRLKGPGTNDYIPYNLSPIAASGTGLGKSSPITVTVGGTIQGADYVNATQGNYSDVVQLSITP